MHSSSSSPSNSPSLPFPVSAPRRSNSSHRPFRNAVQKAAHLGASGPSITGEGGTWAVLLQRARTTNLAVLLLAAVAALSLLINVRLSLGDEVRLLSLLSPLKRS